MLYLITAGVYDDYRVAGLIEHNVDPSDDITLIKTWLHSVNEDEKYLDAYYRRLNNLGWGWDDFAGSKNIDQDDFADWLIEKSGLKVIEYEESNVRGC